MHWLGRLHWLCCLDRLLDHGLCCLDRLLDHGLCCLDRLLGHGLDCLCWHCLLRHHAMLSHRLSCSVGPELVAEVFPSLPSTSS